MGNGTARSRHRLLKNGSRLFFARDLDSPNQLERAQEIRLLARAILTAICRRGGYRLASVGRISRGGLDRKELSTFSTIADGLNLDAPCIFDMKTESFLMRLQ